MCGSWLMRLRSSTHMRDFPIPGSPVIKTTCNSPDFVRCQRRNSNSISSSRPTSGVRSEPRRASNRLWRLLERKTLYASTGPSNPSRSKSSRPRKSNRPPTNRLVSFAINRVPGSAARRSAAARPMASPNRPLGSEPISARMTTGPVAMPSWSCNFSPRVSRLRKLSLTASPALTASSASCSRD
jgi:hypothetical protein